MNDSRPLSPVVRGAAVASSLECASPSLGLVSASCGAAAGAALLVLIGWMAYQARLPVGCLLRRRRDCRRRHYAVRRQLQVPADEAPAPPPRPSPRLLWLPPGGPVPETGYVTPTPNMAASRHSYLLVLTDEQQVPRGVSTDKPEDPTHPRPPGTCSGEPGYLPMRNYPYASTCEEVLRIFQQSGIAVTMVSSKESPYETPRDPEVGLTSFQLPDPGRNENTDYLSATRMNRHLNEVSEYVGQEPPTSAYHNLNAESKSCKTELNLVQSRFLPPPPRPRPPASTMKHSNNNESKP